MIGLPLVGDIEAGGKTLRQVEENIFGSLKPNYLKNPQVTVSIVKYRPFYIMGEVKNPGSYDYVVGITMVNAVAMAGGYTYRARENNLMVVRADDPKRTKELMNHNAAVLPGDVIEVPEKFF